MIMKKCCCRTSVLQLFGAADGYCSSAAILQIFQTSRYVSFVNDSRAVLLSEMKKKPERCINQGVFPSRLREIIIHNTGNSRGFFTQAVKELINNKNIFTIPNIITTSRIVCSPFLGFAIAYDMKLVALSGCIVFGFSDWLDGYLAKKLKQETVLGAFLDPVADKFMIGSLSVGLLYQGLIPAPLVAIFIGRDATLLVLSFIKR